MVQSDKEGTKVNNPPFGAVANPIRAMVAEHQNEGDRFEKIDELSNHYQIPEDACATYFTTIKGLQDFEKDLHRHIHLENNILFPKATELETRLAAGN